MRRRLAVFFDAVRISFSNLKHKLQEHKLLYRLSLLFLIILVFLLIGFWAARALDGVAVEELLRSAKGFAPLIIVGLIILEVVFAPLPGTFVMVASGAIFGTWLGALYSYVGNVIGSMIAFWLAQRFGRPFVEKLTSRKLLEKYDGFFQKYRHYVLLFYCLPIIPVDILSFSCGLSNMRTRKFFLVMALGFIPNTIILAFAGNVMAGLSIFMMVVYVLLLLLVFSVLAWLFRLVVQRLKHRK